MLWPPIIMYLLGMILVLGITEPAGEEYANAPIKLALFWPFVAIWIAFQMIVEQING